MEWSEFREVQEAHLDLLEHIGEIITAVDALNPRNPSTTIETDSHVSHA